MTTAEGSPKSWYTLSDEWQPAAPWPRADSHIHLVRREHRPWAAAREDVARREVGSVQIRQSEHNAQRGVCADGAHQRAKPDESDLPYRLRGFVEHGLKLLAQRNFGDG